MSNPFEIATDESYNPFQSGSSYTDAKPTTTYTAPAAESNYNNLPNNNPGYKDTTMGITISESELAAKEEALARREEKIAQREREIELARANGNLESLNPHKRNFPMILKIYKYYPEEELPNDAVKMVQLLKWTMYTFTFIMFLNALISFLSLTPCASEEIKSPAASIVFACVYFAFGPLVFTEICLMLLYDSLKNKKGARYFFSIITIFLYLAFCIYVIVGLSDYGSFGYIISINLLRAPKNKWVGIVALIFSILGTLHCVFLGWVWWMIVVYFKRNKISELAAREAAGYAANYAVDHKTELLQAAKDHPDVAVSVAQTAGTYT
ncbi:hypothetical protein TVAG_351870 [Trichomonas vaginalis G3]|uniref:Secretory carrier membrane protein n=1 Tax=Trichomonas vaginalis (strain ATCC PRA-98 / G3) TaxID=412133 RepID=A2DZS1_TRIV3|nr:protein transport [Trichomonas vaginalis G3]EAY14139.1 hypothetical protein TVAG_351870 [Trichomonas vaginalis G3]KAI5525149.1 protein transport [Trichomonas vaginalis G3]|eukprot:XP_001326362.1 hypothetical protein [Trichomonas vaginalis G3]